MAPPGGREVGRRSEVSQVVQGWIVVGPGMTWKAGVTAMVVVLILEQCRKSEKWGEVTPRLLSASSRVGTGGHIQDQDQSWLFLERGSREKRKLPKVTKLNSYDP